MRSTIASDISEIKTNLINLTKSFDIFRENQENIITRLTDRIGAVEVVQSRQDERISNLSVFQTTLTLVIGAVATFLGVQKR